MAGVDPSSMDASSMAHLSQASDIATMPHMEFSSIIDDLKLLVDKGFGNIV